MHASITPNPNPNPNPNQDTAAFLLSRMNGLDLGLDYKTFAHEVHPNHILTLA